MVWTAPQVNRIRHQNRIHVHGTDLPDPVATFEELQEEYKLDPRIIQNLQAAGFQNPTPIQMQAIPLMLHVSSLECSGMFCCSVTMFAYHSLFCSVEIWLRHSRFEFALCDFFNFLIFFFCFRDVRSWPVPPQAQVRPWLSACPFSLTSVSPPTGVSVPSSSHQPASLPVR